MSEITADAALGSSTAHDNGHAGNGEVVHATTTGLSNNKLGMWLFLGSECLLFGGLISTYMLYRGRTQNGPKPDQVYDIPFTSISSFILLMSSLTMVLAVSAARRGTASEDPHGVGRGRGGGVHRPGHCRARPGPGRVTARGGRGSV